MAHFLSAYILQTMFQFSATRIFEPKMGFNPEVYHRIILPSSVPLMGGTICPFFLCRECPTVQGLSLTPSPTMYLCAFFLADIDGVTKENSFTILDNKHFVLC